MKPLKYIEMSTLYGIEDVQPERLRFGRERLNDRRSSSSSRLPVLLNTNVQKCTLVRVCLEIPGSMTSSLGSSANPRVPFRPL